MQVDEGEKQKLKFVVWEEEGLTNKVRKCFLSVIYPWKLLSLKISEALKLYNANTYIFLKLEKKL